MIKTLRDLFFPILRFLRQPGKAIRAAFGLKKKIKHRKDTFCVLAFNHLQLAPNGTAKMCCIAHGDISASGQPMTLYRQSLEEIWNSDYMREARRGMSVGEKISACSRCYHEEDVVGTSRRTQMNEEWLGRDTSARARILESAKSTGWRMKTPPSFYQLNLGNLCNLACRMCGSFYSSRIASDPVHNKWMPSVHLEPGRWVKDRLAIGPRPTFGVSFFGFHGYEVKGTPLNWSGGDGHIVFPVESSVQLDKLSLKLRGAMDDLAFQITLNGDKLHEGRIGTVPQEFEFDLGPYEGADELHLALLSETTPPKVRGKILGLALLDATVSRHPAAEAATANQQALTRFDQKGGWWAQPQVIRDEILSHPQELRHLILQGGEPLLIREVGDILKYLCEAGAAPKIVIELTSNMTIVSDETLALLAHFRHVDAGCSIDGIEDDLEYIRYGAKWDQVQANIARMARLPNTKISFNVAIQFYNLMRITDLYRYCDAHDIAVRGHFLVGPHYLSVLVMPGKIRQIALERLRAYLREKSVTSVNRSSAEYLVHFLEQHADVSHTNLLPTFMEFTNDMDVSRNQSFAEVHPELVKLLADCSHPWVYATRHAKAPSREMEVGVSG